MRSLLGAAAALLIATAPSLAGDATAWVRETLGAALHAEASCGAEEAAVRGTLQRLRGVELPETGKVIVVNVPAGVVTAYEDGVPVIESRAVVGSPKTPTPEMSVPVTSIRTNPTWTVPQSIVKRNGWLDRLYEDPGYFESNGFDIMVGGTLMNPWDAAQYDPSDVGAFVQSPGDHNALGRIRISLANSDGIYLHDTNDPGRFEAEARSASAGCVRVESVREIAAWALEVSVDEIDAMIDEGTMTDWTLPRPVRTVIGYWTAWPDAAGSVRYYPDIYGRDGQGGECRMGQQQRPRSGGTWTEYTIR